HRKHVSLAGFILFKLFGCFGLSEILLCVLQAPKWHSLLSSKYTKLKPALLISVILENDTKPTAEQFKAKKAPLRPGSPALVPLGSDELRAVLNEEEGFHQIGPEDVCADMFVLSVTVAFATKLEQLISSSTKLSSEGAEFFFYYTLLGNDVTSEPFQNLLSPNFEPERASVRIRSMMMLYVFCTQIHLCCGNQSLGSTDVSLAGLIKSSADLTKHPATIEGAFILQPPNRVKPSLQSVPPDLQPTVGISVTLRAEDINNQLDIPIENGPKTPVKKGPVPAARHECPRALMTLSPARSPDRPLRSPASSPEHQHSESEAESLCSNDRQAPCFVLSDALVVPDVSKADAADSSVSVSAPKISIPASAHHYCFSLDLRSIRDLRTSFPINCVLRCLAKALASGCLNVMSWFDCELLLLCVIRVPLVVEMWHREPSSGDVLLGSVSIHLSRLLSAEKTRFLDPSGHQHWRQDSHHESRRVLGSGKLAELCYVSVLEDLGFVKAQDVLVSESSQGPNEAETVTRPRETLEYKAALELEMWKEMQEDLFDNQLKQKELSHMQALAEEWRNRDHQREKPMTGLVIRERKLWLTLRSEHEFSMRELQDSGRRLREDCAHQVELERSKVRQLEDLLAQQRQQVNTAENKCKQLEKEFELYRDQQNVRPEVRLQSEINLLTLEKVELERKLESATKSKLHYKQQWGRALKELARFKRREQENAMTRLKKQQQELQHMRLRYLAAEDKEAVKNEKHELQDIRNELNRLKQQEEPRGAREKAQVCVNEKTLLRTGVYTHNDRIISELDRQIQQAMSRRST
uniref:Centrosomal protein 120 n=1 Tax=Sinocyclocheilus rhinocerous TaxID=307959 RepID=A0A673HLT8_9TELE